MTIYVELHSLTDSFRFRRSEWGLAVILAFGWGYIPLIVPGNSFAGPSLALLNESLGETMMALACAAVGTARLAVLIVNGSWRRCSHARMLTAGMSMLIWTMIFVGVLKAWTFSPGIITYIVFLLMDGHTIYEAGLDARYVDEKRHAGGT